MSIEPRHYNATNTQIDILTEEAVSLEIALIACENNIDLRQKNSKKFFYINEAPYNKASANIVI